MGDRLKGYWPWLLIGSSGAVHLLSRFLGSRGESLPPPTVIPPTETPPPAIVRSVEAVLPIQLSYRKRSPQLQKPLMEFLRKREILLVIRA
jgi:hypothetical protein